MKNPDLQPDIETSSENYARRFQGETGEWFLEVQEKAVLRLLAGQESASVLDVGGGHGQLTGPLIKQGYKVTVMGSDSSCRNRIEPYLKARQCEFKEGNVLNLPFEDKSFDVVISFRLIAHIEDWPQLVSEISRVAKKAVVLDYPAWRSLNFLSPLFFKFKKEIEKNTRPFYSFFEGSLTKVFGECGFERSDRFGEFFLPMALYRAIKQPGFAKAAETFFRRIGLTYCFGSPVILKMDRKRV